MEFHLPEKAFAVSIALGFFCWFACFVLLRKPWTKYYCRSLFTGLLASALPSLVYFEHSSHWDPWEICQVSHSSDENFWYPSLTATGLLGRGRASPLPVWPCLLCVPLTHSTPGVLAGSLSKFELLWQDHRLGGLWQQTFISQFRRLDFHDQVAAWLSSGGASSRLQGAAFSVYPHGRALINIRAPIPFMRTPPSWPHLVLILITSDLS